MVTKIFQILLLLSPIITAANVAPEMLEMITFRLGVIILLAASLLDKPKREIPQDIKWIVLGLFGISLFNIFIHTFTPVVMMSTLNLFFGLIGFCILYIYLDEKLKFEKYILWAGFINLLLFLSQQLRFDPVFDIRNYEIGEEGAFLGNKQQMMTYFTLLTPYLKTPFLILSLILGIYTKQIIILIPFTIILFRKLKTDKEKIGFGIVVLLGTALLRNKILQALNYRLDLWKPALRLFFDRSFLGYGLGVKINGIDVLGNSYLQFIIGTGIMGAVWFGYVFKKFHRQMAKDVSMFSLSGLMAIEYVMEIPRLWYLVMAIIIMFLIKQKGVLQNEGSQ